MSEIDVEDGFSFEADDDRVSNAPDRFYTAFSLLGLGFVFGMFNPIVIPALVIIAGVLVIAWAVAT